MAPAAFLVDLQHTLQKGVRFRREEAPMRQDDAALVAQVLGGDTSAFAPLIDWHRPGAVRLARRLLGDPADAEDVVQEALLQAFLGLSDLRLPEPGLWRLADGHHGQPMPELRLRRRHAVASFEDWYGGRVVPDFRWGDRQPSPEAASESPRVAPHRPCHHQHPPPEQQQAVRLHYLDGLDAGGYWSARRGAGRHRQGAVASGAGRGCGVIWRTPWPTPRNPPQAW